MADTSYLPTLGSYTPLRGNMAAPLMSRSQEVNPYIGSYDPPAPNWFTSGVHSGFNELLGLGATAVQAVGQTAGLDPVERWGAAAAENRFAAAQAAGRPDLEVPPWEQGGASVLPWLGYQGAKFLPQLVGQGLAAYATGGASVPEGLSALGAELPTILGGGGMRAAIEAAGGDTAKIAAARAAAHEAGTGLARTAMGVTAFNAPIGVGMAYQAAEQKPGGATVDDATNALALGPVLGALGALGPSQTFGVLARGLEGNIVRRVATSGLTGVSVGAIQSGVQTAITDTMNTDITPTQRAQNIIDSVITGGALGGIMGGIAGLRHAPAHEVTTDQLEQSTAPILSLPAPEARQQLPAPTEQKLLGAPQPVEEASGQLTLPGTGSSSIDPGAALVDPRLAGSFDPRTQESRPHAALSDEQLDAAIETSQQKVRGDGGITQATQNDALVRSQLQRELNLRDAEGTQSKRAQGLFADEDLPDQNKPGLPYLSDSQLDRELGKPTAADIAVQQTREAAAKLAGGSNQFIKSLDAKDMPDLINAVKERLGAGDDSVRTMKLAESLGILDKAGQERNHAQDLKVAESMAEQAKVKALVNVSPELKAKAVELKDQVEQMRTRQEILNEADRRAATPEEAPANTQDAVAPVYPAVESKIHDAIMAAPTGEKPPIDISAVPRSGAPLADPVEATSALQEHHENLSAIASDTTLPPEFRRSAEAARSDLARGVEGAGDKANAVYADIALHDGTIRFSGSKEAVTGKPLSDAAFKTVFDAATRGLPDRVKNSIHVVNSAAELPQVMHYAAAKQGFSPGDIHGAFYKGDVYIVRDRAKTPTDITEIVKHEVFGHSAAQALYGDKFSETMRKAFDQAGGLDGLRAIAKKFNVSDDFEGYIPKDNLTNTNKIDLMDELLAQAAGKASGTLKNAAMAWVGGLKQALVKVLNATGFANLAQQLGRLSPSDVAYTLNKMRKAVKQVGSEGVVDNTPTFKARRVQDTLEALPGIVKMVSDMVPKNIASLERKSTLQKFALSAWTTDHIAAVYKRVFPEVGAVPILNTKQRDIRSRVAELGGLVLADHELLARNKPKVAEGIVELMRATELGIDPRRSFEEQTHLSQDKTKEYLKPAADRYYALYRKVNQTGGGKVYADYVTANRTMLYAQHAVSLHMLMAADPIYAQKFGVGNDGPMERFLADIRTSKNVQRSFAFWKAELGQLLGAVKSGYEGLPTQPTTPQKLWTAADKAANIAREQAMPLQKLAASIHAAVKSSDSVPYFALLRKGDYHFSFKISHDADTGFVNQKAQDAVAARLKTEKFMDAQISSDSRDPKVFMRLENLDQVDRLHQIAQDLAKQGFVVPDDFTRGQIQLSDFGKRDDIFRQQVIKTIQSDPQFKITAGMTDEEKVKIKSAQAALVSQTTRIFLDQLADGSISKSFVQRDARPGYSPDMPRSYAERYSRAASALSYRATVLESGRTYNGMRDAINKAQKSGIPTSQLATMNNVYAELALRKSLLARNPAPGILDTASVLTQSWYVGLSPSNMLVQLTQIPTLLLPELGRKYGFVEASRAIASATGPAFKILRSTVAEAAKRDWRAVGDAVITEGSIKATGVTGVRANLLMQLEAAGQLGMGSAARNLMRMADETSGGKFNLAMRLASSTSMYAETMTRLVAALAAHKLHGGEGPDMFAYVSKTIDQSMMKYDADNGGRLFSKNSPLLGRYTPLAFKFMTFNLQYMEKMYRELGNAFTLRAGSAAERKESLRFLGGHLAAMTVLAGTLGLPGAAAAAGAADKLSSMFGEGSYDINASWHNFLAHTFGAGVGDVLTRGVPHALGFDLSSRIGAQDILPFTSFLTSHQKFQDTASDWFKSMGGAPVSMVSNVVDGGIKLYNGQILEGMKSALPSTLRNLTVAFQMSQYGYMDSHGNKIPMTPGARDVLMQALGLRPADKAVYDEAKLEQSNRQQDLTRTSGIMKQNLAMAIERGNMPQAQELIARARSWDQKNPSYSVLMGLASTLMQRAQARGMSGATGLPMGTNIRDQGAREVGDWARGLVGN